MVLFKPSNVFESQYKNQCYLPARTYWITSQTSPGIHASDLCWRYRTFASRDFSELSCLFQDFTSLPVSLEFFFPLFIWNQTVHICIHDHFAQTMCKWKCHPSCSRRLGLKDWLIQKPHDRHKAPSPASPYFFPLQPPQTAPGQHRLGNNTTANGKCWKNRSHPLTKTGNVGVRSALREVLSVCTHRMA